MFDYLQLWEQLNTMDIENVSFIVIVLNEEFAIKKCLSSIEKMPLVNCEIICIDSGSTDNTLAIMKSYRNTINTLRIYKVMGEVNAAVARNVGIKYASKKNIFFIDGDVELNDTFIACAVDVLNNEVYSAVVGKLKEYQYDDKYKEVISLLDDRNCITNRKTTYSCGGIFVATNEAVNKTGTFNESMKCFEDADFTLRMTSKYKMMAIPENMGIHHTIPYENKTRLLKELKDFRYLSLGFLLKKNFFNNKRGVISFLLHQKGILYGLFFLIVLLCGFFFLPILYILLSMFIFDIAIGIFCDKNIFRRIVLHYAIPVFTGLGFFFHPHKNKDYSTKSV